MSVTSWFGKSNYPNSYSLAITDPLKENMGMDAHYDW